MRLVWVLVCFVSAASAGAAEPQVWLGPQAWTRDTDAPIISLGSPGAFDDTHIFAPCVVREQDRYLLWYCGSQGTVAQRVFQLGLARSSDGREFELADESPVFAFGDGRHSVLTPTVLRNADGTPLREDGRLRIWFSATDFQDRSGLHTLHASTSTDGVHWQEPSPPLLEHVYAPSVIRTDEGYRMWFTDVSHEPWVISEAHSPDGRNWTRSAEPVLEVDKSWERDRLFYPCVIEIDGLYLMWYGSYWSGRPSTTALGFAVSRDGLQWVKHPDNPVLRPDPERPWESHYVTSHSVMRLPEGGFRIWYASRTAPPFVHKYFALNTAHWDGPAAE